MSIFGDIGKALGGVVGNAVVPGLGGVIGGALGGKAGDLLGGLAGKALDQITKDPVGALTNPLGAAAKYADTVLGDMGLPAPFRQLTKFAENPMKSIMDILGGKDHCTTPTVGKNGDVKNNNDLATNGKDTVDTGRYLISAREDGLKIYDKQTKTWVDCSGDPHVRTSDGDKGQFHENLTIDLPDGTTVKIKTTPQQQDGTAFIDKVAVMKGDEAVVMSGFHDGRQGVNMGEVFHNKNEVNHMWGDGTVLKAGHEVDDLFFKTGGEFRGTAPGNRFGEINLDGHGGRSQADAPLFPKFPFPGGLGGIIGGAIGGIVNGGNNNGGTPPAGNGGTAPASGNAPTCEPPSAPSTGGTSSGGGIYEKIFAILQKLQNQLNDKVKSLDGLDPKNDKAALDKGLFEVQQLQQQMTQLTSMATNLSSADHNSKKGIVDNLNIR